MSAEEAKSYGLIDHVVTNREEVETPPLVSSK